MQAFLNRVKEFSSYHWQGGVYQWIFYAGIILVLIFEKRKTIKVIFGWMPVAYLICIYNPLFWSAMSFAGATTYNSYFARMFSFIPLMYTIAMGIVCLLGKVQGWLKFLLVGIVCVFLGITGTSIFSQDWYTSAKNPNKVSQDAYEVALVMKDAETEDGNIRIATIEPVTNYMRQLADFITPYARNLDTLAYVLSADPPDVMVALKMAGEQDMDYILTHRTEATINAFAEQGYEPYALTTNMAIYKVTGVKRTRRTLNESRQVVAITQYDENGNIIRAKAGYSIVAYEYDENGFRTVARYLDEDGNPVDINGGYASFHQEYSDRGLVKSTIYKDKNGNPVLIEGRFETRNDYNIYGKLIKESYYDEQGKPMLRTDGLYASREIKYNNNGIIIGEKYFDTEGDPCISASEYAEVRRELDENSRVIREAYYDAQGNSCAILAGYAAFSREYDEMGNLLYETYYDAENNLTKRNTG
ncbi:MAG: DMT family transporter, partial [Lachnospiraceae bacterium]|nr:DMT family transporter [Lachnospiraceae bacterium]